MAFYHTNGCSCPIGDCWCGTEWVYFNKKTKEISIFRETFDDHLITKYHVCIGEL